MATLCSVGSNLCHKNAGHICSHALAVIRPCLHQPLLPMAAGHLISSCRRLDPNRAPTAGHDRPDRPSHQLRMSTTCLAPKQLAICAAARALMRQSFLMRVQRRKLWKMGRGESEGPKKKLKRSKKLKSRGSKKSKTNKIIPK